MKTKKILALLVLPLLIGGCSCSKVNEKTYENAYSNIKSTDAIYFTRIEEIKENGETTYLRKRVDAKYYFTTTGQVDKMEYSLTYTDTTVNGLSDVRQVSKFYFDRSSHTYYTYKKVGSTQEYKYKENAFNYDDMINVTKCGDDKDCILMMVVNLVPAKGLNEVEDFTINDDDGEGIVSYKAVCPSFEACSDSSQVLDYKLTINKNGEFSTLSYVITNNDVETTVKYTFLGIGSNNVSIEFPSDIETYIEKNS